MKKGGQLPSLSDTMEPQEVPSLDSDSFGSGRAASAGGAHWHPGVRLILVLLVVLPILATGVFTGTGVVSGWSFRQHAQVVAEDASRLQTVATARAQMNPLSVPLLAVSYSAQLGITEPVLDKLLKPTVPYSVQLAQGTARIAGYPTFSSTPALRADVTELRALIPQVMANTVSFTVAQQFMAKMSSDIDAIWYRDYNRLQADISNWQAPGSFEVHAAALRQTYLAFLTGGHEVEGAIYVLEGIGPTTAKQEMIQASGEFNTATAEFAGQLSPKAQAVWTHIQTDPADKHFAGTIQQGLTVALNGRQPPFVDNLVFAGELDDPGPPLSGRPELAGDHGVEGSPRHGPGPGLGATHRLVGEIVFLALLILVSVGGVIVGGRMLTRPLKRLAAAAFQVHSGDFEVSTTARDGPPRGGHHDRGVQRHGSTLKAVEVKAVALAGEDLSHLELLSPLPGQDRSRPPSFGRHPRHADPRAGAAAPAPPRGGHP